MVIDGKSIASERSQQLKTQLELFSHPIKVVAIIVGDDLASQRYVALKAKLAQEIGIESQVINLSKDTTTAELTQLIKSLNQDPAVTGILVQLPLPSQINSSEVLNSIYPSKDVDGLSNQSSFLPATVKGVLSILPSNLTQKTITVVGQGKLVGFPLANVLEKMGANVIRCDEETSDLKAATLQGDVLVVATGVEKLISADMVKEGAIVIDCGAPKAEVDFEAVCQVASAITPVPGGVGPLTIVSLLENTLEAAKIAANTHTERINP